MTLENKGFRPNSSELHKYSKLIKKLSPFKDDTERLKRITKEIDQKSTIIAQNVLNRYQNESLTKKQLIKIGVEIALYNPYHP